MAPILSVAFDTHRHNQCNGARIATSVGGGQMASWLLDRCGLFASLGCRCSRVDIVSVVDKKMQTTISDVDEEPDGSVGDPPSTP